MPFDEAFFVRWQAPLLILLNLPIVGKAFRRSLWIDEPLRVITKISPTAVHVWRGGNRFEATFHSDPQHAEALHRSFGWLWAVVHAWDMKIANKFAPALNFGLDTYTSQPDNTDGKDNYIRSDSPGLVVNGTILTVGEISTTTTVCRTLIQFDFSSIPSGAVASSAIFSLWLFQDFATNTSDHTLYRCKRDWVENQATWNSWKTSNLWATAGGFGVTDTEQTAIASRAMTATEANGEKQWTAWDLDMLGEMWDGTWTNYGWMIKSETEDQDAYQYRSSAYGTAGERPKLVIQYTVGGDGGGFFAYF